MWTRSIRGGKGPDRKTTHPPAGASNYPPTDLARRFLSRIGSEGQRAIRQAFAGHKLEGQVALALCGLRVGEILGLRIRASEEDQVNGDVVLDGNRPLVRVRQVVIRVEGEGAKVRGYPKSETSIRDVPLPTWAGPILRSAKRRALEMPLRFGETWEEHDLLFPSRGQPAGTAKAHGREAVPGRAMHPAALSLAFKKRLRQASLEGLDAVSPHALRHTFVSVLVNEAGMRAEDVQHLAGHADLRTTQRYRARDDSTGETAAKALGELARIEGDAWSAGD